MTGALGSVAYSGGPDHLIHFKGGRGQGRHQDTGGRPAGSEGPPVHHHVLRSEGATTRPVEVEEESGKRVSVYADYLVRIFDGVTEALTRKDLKALGHGLSGKQVDKALDWGTSNHEVMAYGIKSPEIHPLGLVGPISHSPLLRK